MRKLISLVLILALPTMAFAATDVALKSGGLASLEYVVGSAPATLPLDVVVITDRAGTGQNGIWAVGGGIDGPAGLSVTGVAYKTGWAVIGAYPLPQPLDSDQDWGGQDSNASFANAIAGPGGTAVMLTISGIDGLGVGSYAFKVTDSNMADAYNNTGYWGTGGGEQFGFDASIPFVLKIVNPIPEPATMLLLAGALPFLRRRSA